MIIDFASFWQNINNMKKATLYVLITITMLAILGSCHQSHKKELDLAYVLAESNPDSALSFLNHINQNKLSEEDMAKYALIYYMAQDKSGLDVDNDSLIRIAYIGIKRIKKTPYMFCA